MQKSSMIRQSWLTYIKAASANIGGIGEKLLIIASESMRTKVLK